VTGLSLEEVKAALLQFEGTLQQIPPNYSAIQVQGKRLYDLARAGEIIDVPARTVEVYKIEILDWRTGEFPELEVAIACGSGTYIRAIARDLGASLQVGGTLAALIRTESSGFSLSNSLTFEELEAQIQQKTFHPIPPAEALRHLAAITLSPKDAQKWCNGQRIPYVPFSTDGEGLEGRLIRVYREDDQFLGIAQLMNSETNFILIPQMVFESN
jgi:tRNA pseudouridine55 synthase